MAEKFALTLDKFESIRKDEPVKSRRFIGLMQEDRKIKNSPRKKYSNIDFKFEFND